MFRLSVVRVMALVAASLMAAGCELLPGPSSTASSAPKSLAPAASVQVLKSEEEFAKQTAAGLMPTLAVFYAPGSLSGKMLDPVLNRAAASFAGKVKVVKINADQQAKLAKTNNVSETPTFVGYVAGKEVKRLVGPQTPAAIKGLMEALLTPAK